MQPTISLRFGMIHPGPPTLTMEELEELLESVGTVYDYASTQWKNCKGTGPHKCGANITMNILGMLFDQLWDYYYEDE